MTPEETAHIMEFGEAEACADMCEAAPPDYAHQLGISVRRYGSAYGLACTAADVTLFNRVVGLGLKEPATESMLAEITTHYKSLGIKNFGIQLSPAAQPADLPQHLAKLGWRAHGNWVKVIRGPDSPPMITTDFRIELLKVEQAQAFADVGLSAFEMPPFLRLWLMALFNRPQWRLYGAFDGDSMVATGALFITGKTGWLGIGSTLHSHRGRGAQGALMAQRIRDGAGLGCEWLITETGEDTPANPNPSYHNMIRTGFKPVYLRPNYLLVSR